MYTTVDANKEQANKLLHKHLKPFGLNLVLDREYDYDQFLEDEFVTILTLTGKTVEYKMRNGKPCFAEFSGFGKIRYNIAYPEDFPKELYEFLKYHADKAKNYFWKGGQV